MFGHTSANHHLVGIKFKTPLGCIQHSFMFIPDHSMGLPVLPALSLGTCCCHYPGAAAGRRHRSSHPAVSVFPERVIGSACTSTFSRLARHSLASRPAHSQLPPIRGTLTEGFSHLVASMTAPVASGWSGRRVGFTPTGKAPPYHGAHPLRSEWPHSHRPECRASRNLRSSMWAAYRSR